MAVRPHGRRSLNHPSIAKALPNGDIIATDDHNHRVIVVDPQTNQIVWQYGHLGTAGRHPDTSTGPMDSTSPHHTPISNLETAPSH